MSGVEETSRASDQSGLSMQATLDLQRESLRDEGVVSAATRIDRIDRAIDLLRKYDGKICDALNADFGSRSIDQSRLTDVNGSIGPLEHARKNVKKWMRSEKRKVTFPLGVFGARARVDYQPLGVVGVIGTWNFPVNVALGPLAGIFAAGNRCMIKPSEFTPATSGLMSEMISGAYDISEAAVFQGGPEVGVAFSSLAFDHLLFTGSPSVAKHVMRAASENLVPVTLELGGKSPVVIGRSADMQRAADNVMFGKTLNAGQICLSPDYVFVPEERVDDFINAAEGSVAKMYPNLKDNPDYTSVVNERNYERLRGYLEDAKAKGAGLVEINPADEDFSQQQHHRIPPTLIIDPKEDMQVMQDEIFGPLLPVMRYKDVTEAINYINDHPRPLGLYYFGNDKREQSKVLSHTTSGGVTVNDVLMHVTMEDLPFGGVGNSGMGHYHGYDGFKTFSHAKAILTQSRTVSRLAASMRPPHKQKE